MLAAPGIPSTMRAAQAVTYGLIDEVLTVANTVKVPRLADLPEKERRTSMLIRVHAVSLAPGDVRVISGRTRELQGPRSLPYVPGGDAVGIIVELDKEATDLPFKLGDRVAARFVDGPRGALGEYAIVSTKVADTVPDDMPSVHGAALVSATPAVLLADRVKQGERVLVFGASGGVGSHLCQLLRDRQVSKLVGVSDKPQQLLKPPLLCDEAISYIDQDVFTMYKYVNDPFDVVIDLHGGAFYKFGSQSVVKPASHGGRYLTTTPDQPWYDVHSIWQAIQIFLLPGLWRALKSRTWSRRSLPKYSYVLAIPSQSNEVVRKAFSFYQQGRLQAVLANDNKPFPFTTHGVREAFHLQESRHTKGKIIVTVAEH